MHLSACVSMSVPECVYVHVPGPEGCPDRGAPGDVRTDKTEFGDRSGGVNIISMIGIRHPRRSHKCVGAL